MVMLVLASFWVADMIGPDHPDSDDIPFGVYSGADPNSGIVSISSTDSAEVGETIEIDIEIDPSEAIAGAQFDLTFDPSLITVNNVQEGDLLTQDGASSYFNTGEIDNQSGTVDGVAGVIITPGQTVSEAEVFATVTLTTKTIGGIGPLILTNVVLGNADGQSVSVSVMNDDDPATNEPPVLAYIGNQRITQGQSLQFTVSAIDPNSDNLSYTVINLPIGALFYTSNQTFSWTPTTIGVYNNVHFQVTDGEFVDSEDVTIIVTAAENTPSGGGGGAAGGGGGGGGSVVSSSIDISPAINPKPASSPTHASQPTLLTEPPQMILTEETPVTATIDLVNDLTGLITENTNRHADNGNWLLSIPKGTRNLTVDGETLEQITVTEMPDPPTPPTVSNYIGVTYDFGPDGATFEPPITLSISYDDSEIPENIDEENLVIATWDDASNTWIYLTSMVDPVNNIVTSQISHFSAYTIISPNDIDASITTSISATVNGTPEPGNSNEEISTESSDETPVVNWAVLGQIIGIAVALSAVAAFVVFMRRRRLLGQEGE